MIRSKGSRLNGALVGVLGLGAVMADLAGVRVAEAGSFSLRITVAPRPVQRRVIYRRPVYMAPRVYQQPRFVAAQQRPILRPGLSRPGYTQSPALKPRTTLEAMMANAHSPAELKGLADIAATAQKGMDAGLHIDDHRW